jgi:hypothetical protein
MTAVRDLRQSAHGRTGKQSPSLPDAVLVFSFCDSKGGEI